MDDQTTGRAREENSSSENASSKLWSLAAMPEVFWVTAGAQRRESPSREKVTTPQRGRVVGGRDAAGWRAEGGVGGSNASGSEVSASDAGGQIGFVGRLEGDGEEEVEDEVVVTVLVLSRSAGRAAILEGVGGRGKGRQADGSGIMGDSDKTDGYLLCRRMGQKGEGCETLSGVGLPSQVKLVLDRQWGGHVRGGGSNDGG